MRNTGLEEAQAGIKIARRNINNLRYADDTTLMAKSEEELKNLLMKMKEESEKVGLKLNIHKTKIMASGPITSWQIDGETVRYFISVGSKITEDGDCNHEIKRHSMEKEVAAHSSTLAWKIPWTVTYNAPPSMQFSRQEYWSGLPFPSPEDLPNPVMEPESPAL